MKVLDNLHAFIWREVTGNNCNTYCIDGSKKILIDPGHRQLFGHVEQGLAEVGLSLQQIDLVIITHGHPDHMEAIQVFQKPTLFAMSLEEMEYYKKMAEHYPIASALDSLNPDFFLQEGEFRVGKETFQVVLTPGHSPGSICIYWPEYKALFTGDVVFNQGIGRTDLPGGSGKLLKESIEKVANLDVEYLLPGHGEIVTGRKSVMDNFKIIEIQWFDYLQ
ncbi:MAG: MBL fold metallo-hydrolase [Desulfobacteraceae bacterium]|nr:MBL fold metallo-hydrolase [Desulfobacteraceae bacterium]